MTENNTVDVNLCFFNGTNAAGNGGIETRTTDTLERVAYWINVAMACELAFAICCNGVALRIMLKCKKLPDSIRYLSINFIIAFLATAASNFTLSVTRLSLGSDNCYHELIFDLRTFLSLVFLLVLWCTICALTLERFIAIQFPYKYARIVTKTTLKVVISILWSFNTIVSSAMLYAGWVLVCGQYSYNYIFTCDNFAIFKPVKLFVTLILCVLYIITIAVYIKVLLCIRHHQKAIQVLNQSSVQKLERRSHPFSKMILPIVLSFILLQSPYILTTIVLELKPDAQQRSFRISFHIVYYICLVLNNYVTLYLYVWKFPECRMTFYHMFAKTNSRYSEKADALRMEIFGIVTFSRSNGTSSTNDNDRSYECNNQENGVFSNI